MEFNVYSKTKPALKHFFSVEHNFSICLFLKLDLGNFGGRGWNLFGVLGVVGVVGEGSGGYILSEEVFIERVYTWLILK